MTKMFCDACGAELVDKKATLEFHTKLSGSDNKTRNAYMDLCEDCLNKAIAFIDGFKGNKS